MPNMLLGDAMLLHANFGPGFSILQGNCALQVEIIVTKTLSQCLFVLVVAGQANCVEVGSGLTYSSSHS